MEPSRPSVPNKDNPNDAQNVATRNVPAAPPQRQAATNRANGDESSSGAPTNSVLPKLLRGLFWDCPFDDLRLPEDRPFIIGRVLTSGSWSQVCWLREKVGDDCLRQWIRAREGRPLDPRQLRFWELILDLPSLQVDAWLACRSHSPWDRRTCREMGQREMDS